jgi:outer membrane protein assembly factor BamA
MTIRNSVQLRAGDKEITNLKFSDFGKLQFEPVKNAIDLSYVEPWFLAYRLPLTIGTVYEPDNKNPIIDKYFDRLSVETSLARELNRYTNIRLTGRIEFVKIRDVQPDEEYILREQGNTLVRRRLSLYGQRDTRDNILIPQKGSYSYSYIDYVGGILGGDFSYLKGEFYWSRFNKFIGENILATRIDIGALHDLKTDGSGPEDRFTLGGAKTVRGFNENDMGVKYTLADGIDSTSSLFNQPKGGRLMVLANIEIRRPLFWRFGGTAFIDMGNVFYEIKDFKPDRIEVTPGLGMQFFTPIGPIRLDRGVQLKKNFDLGAGAWHLTILYAF